MIEKLSLEEFRRIKEELSILVKNFDQELDENLFNKDYDENLKEEEFEKKYYAVQSKLLSYDLSDIPFEEWKGIEIHSDDNSIADFSNTSANIDFSLLNLDNYFVAGSFKGCNIKNLKELSFMINEVNFDDVTIQNNSSLFLSNIFNNVFKDKYYNNKLNIEDLAYLSNEQLLELKKKKVIERLDKNNKENLIIEKVGIDKSIELYEYSKEDYTFVLDVLLLVRNRFPVTKFKPEIQKIENFIQSEITNTDAKDIKEKFNSYLREFITKTKFSHLELEEISKNIIDANKDLFLIDESIDDNLKYKFYNRRLTMKDVLENMELFENFPVENFLEQTFLSPVILGELGYGNLVKLMKKHYDVFKHIIDSEELYDFSMFLSRYSNYNIERKFTLAIKMYYLERFIGTKPDWLKSMNFNFVEKLQSAEDLMEYDDNTLIEDVHQQKFINIFGIDNLKKLEEETKIFSDYYRKFDIFYILSEQVDIKLLKSKDDLDFKLGMLPYKEFRDKFAKYLDILRSDNRFTIYSNYDFIKGSFREDYKEIFMDESAPFELKERFYENAITPNFLFEHKEYIPYLVDKNLLNVLNINMKLVRTSHSGIHSFNFIEEYLEIFDNEKLLNLVSKYGNILTYIEIKSDFWEIYDEKDEKEVEKLIKDAIYKKIKFENYNYSYLKDVEDFTSYHPEIFANFSSLKNIYEDEKKELERRYYTKKLIYDDIKENPELIEILKDKDLYLCFHEYDEPYYIPQSGSLKCVKDLDLVTALGNEKFLKLCQKYGRYLRGIVLQLNNKLMYENKTYYDLDKKHKLSFEEIDKKIEEIITNGCLKGEIDYYEDAPEFLKKSHPELFLSENAPESLKHAFYCKNVDFTFFDLHYYYNHGDTRHFLKGKKVSVALLRNQEKREQIKYFFEVFGEDLGIKLGINKWNTVSKMLNISDIDLMKKWYDKTGCKFLPDYVVMHNIDIEEADKFLSNGHSWSKLMKLKDYKDDLETKEAMLKLAYSFGVFDGDKRGFNKLYELLTGVPKQISREFKQDIDINNKDIAIYVPDISRKHSIDLNKKEILNNIIEKMSNDNFIGYRYGGRALIDLMIGIRDENIDIDFSLPIFSQIYKENEDGSYTLKINSQNCPKTVKALRKILLDFEDLNLLDSDRLHQLFGGFKLEYNPEFREFLLDNLSEILSNSNYTTYISSIQRQFKDIKRANSNRKLTLDLAISYVQENKYEDVEVGNEGVAIVSAIAGYTQEDFDTLQKIYNYGKLRIFSSIPRIEGNNEKYTYEMLRLDDPLAMAIGTLTDCCQEIGNMAEVCMEHSMVDKNGRVFVIRDSKGNIVSQSWVWRNGDVVCFDNIEIPNKAFDRVNDRKKFTNEVYEIYKEAAEELIKKDEKEYKKLLDEGKIKEEQYEGLKLKKVTVGLGYNDIAASIKKQTVIDTDVISRPLPFDPPVDLDRDLYTSDSNTQYVLEDNFSKTDGQALLIHNDVYKVYDSSNLEEKNLLLLEKLEALTTNYDYISNISYDEFDSEQIMKSIADIYDLNQDVIRIIMNPNFAIIYGEINNKIIIYDLFYNTRIENNEQKMDIENVVIMQLRLALEQIGKDKKIYVSDLDKNQRDIYNKAMNLKEEIDIEKGLKNTKSL